MEVQAAFALQWHNRAGGLFFLREIHGVENAGGAHKYNAADTEDAAASRRKGIYRIGK